MIYYYQLAFTVAKLSLLVWRVSMRELYLSADAFWSITLASIEVFKKECFGLLVGYGGSE